MEKQSQDFTILGDVKVNRMLFNWFNLLKSANNEQGEAELSVIFDQTGNVFSTVMKYRRKLLQNNPIKQTLNMENTEQFRQQLEQIFWEPVSFGYSEKIKGLMEKNQWSAEALINEHLKNPERRVWAIICCKNQYITC